MPKFQSGTYRKLYLRIWISLRGLTLEEKAIAVYLLTGDQTNRIGIYNFSVGKAVEDLETSTERCQTGLAHVIERLEWEYDKTNRVIFIPTWWKWNPPENPSVLKGNLKDLQGVADSPLIDKFINNAEYLKGSENLLKTFCETCTTRHPTPVPTPVPHQKQKQKQKQKQELKSSCPSGDGPDPIEAPAKADPTPYQAIAQAWNDHAPRELPRVRFPFASDRQAKVRAQWKVLPNLDYWTQLFKDLALSPFYTGGNERKWKADIDFVFRKHVSLTELFANERPKVMLQAKADCPHCKGIGMVFEMVDGRRYAQLCDCRKEVG